MSASDMLIEYMAESTILRTEKLAKKKVKDKVKEQVQWLVAYTRPLTL
jgi:hypothetical protein